MTNRELKQQLFDRIVSHLAKQQAPAVGDWGGCAYRDPAGRSCAVGCLIADEHYSAEFEMLDVDVGPVRQALRASLPKLPTDPLDFDEIILFLNDCQVAHDQWNDALEELELHSDKIQSAVILNGELSTVALRYRLEFTSISF